MPTMKQTSFFDEFIIEAGRRSAQVLLTFLKALD